MDTCCCYSNPGQYPDYFGPGTRPLWSWLFRISDADCFGPEASAGPYILTISNRYYIINIYINIGFHIIQIMYNNIWMLIKSQIQCMTCVLTHFRPGSSPHWSDICLHSAGSRRVQDIWIMSCHFHLSLIINQSMARVI